MCMRWEYTLDKMVVHYRVWCPRSNLVLAINPLTHQHVLDSGRKLDHVKETPMDKGGTDSSWVRGRAPGAVSQQHSPLHHHAAKITCNSLFYDLLHMYLLIYTSWESWIFKQPAAGYHFFCDKPNVGSLWITNYSQPIVTTTILLEYNGSGMMCCKTRSVLHRTQL